MTQLAPAWSAGFAPNEYKPRSPESTVLRQVLLGNLETFLAETKAKSENGEGVPLFVERSLRLSLECGVPAKGFARIKCNEGVTTNRRGMNPAATMSGFVSYTMPDKP